MRRGHFFLVCCVAIVTAEWDDNFEDDYDEYEERQNPEDLLRGTIMEAVSQNDWARVIQMAGSGHNLNVQNEYQETALHMCSAPHRPQKAALQALLNAGADLDVQDADGCTPLVWAVHNNHFENAQMLLKAGASWKELRDNKGRTAADHAISSKMKQLFGEAAALAAPQEGVLDVEDFEQEVVNAEVDVCLYAYSASCFYCREFSPVFENIAATLRSTSIRFRQVDIYSTSPPKEFATTSTPTIFLKKQGVLVPAVYQGERSLEGVVQWLQNHATHRFMWTQGGGGEVPLAQVLKEEQQQQATRPNLDEL